MNPIHCRSEGIENFVNTIRGEEEVEVGEKRRRRKNKERGGHIVHAKESQPINIIQISM